MSEASEQPGSVTRQLQNLEKGNQGKAAQEELFRRYYRSVLEKARRRVRRLAVVDASDVAVSVWDTIFRGLPEGRYPCEDREEFEELLGKITYHKAVNLFNWVKRPQRHPSEKLENEKILEAYPLEEQYREAAELYYLKGKTLQEIAASLEVTPDVIEQRLAHVHRWLQKHRYQATSHAGSDAVKDVAGGERPLDVLLFEELLVNMEGKLRETVILKLQGLDNRQIAERLDVTERQVQRRLKLLRDLLTAELADISTDR